MNLTQIPSDNLSNRWADKRINTMKKCTSLIIGLLTTISFLAVFPKVSFTNDAPINLQGGGALALTGPLTVAMESEVVKINVGTSSYIVDASFNFFN